MQKLPEDPGWMGDRKRGAGWGRSNHAAPCEEVHKFYLRHIPINSGGYDAGGAYWGLGNRLYWAYSEFEGRTDIERWFRARNREAAKAEVRKDYPNAVFWR